MKDRYIIYISYSALITIMFLVLVFKKTPTTVIDYDKIIKGYEVVIDSLKADIASIRVQNNKLFTKIESIKSSFPDRRKELLQINKEIKKINELYKKNTYRDSTDNSLISRLSR
jgi:peptidoglycan hydrolase CwlO-like protein